jgi:hypothetical protein
MGLLLILFLLVIYLLIARKCTRSVKGWLKLPVVIFFVLVPTADAVYGRAKLSAMCREDSGVKFNKSVPDVEGFSTGKSKPYEDWVTKYGYSYVEGYRFGLPSSGILRFVYEGENKVVEKIDVKGVLTSRYQLERRETDSGTYLHRQESVVDLATKETLATDTTIIYFGGWLERAISGLYASRETADYCPKNDDSYGRLVLLVTTTLKPKTR